MKSVTTSLNDVLKDLTELAERQIDEELTRVAMFAIEQHKQRIVDEVKNRYVVACYTRLVQSMDRDGLYLEFSFQPKKESK